MTRFLAPIACLLLVGLGAYPAPAGLIANGNFESVSGDPLKFDGWTYDDATRFTVQSRPGGSVISGNYSAEIVRGNVHNLYQTPSEAVSSFIFNMDFAVFPNTGDRTMNTQLWWAAGGASDIAVQLRVGSDNRLQAYDGGAWRNIGTLAADTTVDTGTPNVWNGEEPVVNHLSIVGHFGATAPYYDVTLNANTVSNLQFFQSTVPAGATVGPIRFQANNGASNWLVDNVSFVPEPSGAAMLGALVLFALAPWRRRHSETK
ncbi:MAG: hypothetical protein RBS80_27575 [Thermoguttaceae bacterium]|jgi:MYXO-CTERM domain-containing protein|nr:hypothetical protein [Thermoguttaceae bacterium]